MLDKYLSVNKNFKASVNLQYDLFNEDKIREYVPTTDLCDVIKQYLNSIITGEGLKSTLLAGPYGKGKSYLMLMITYLISAHSNRELFKYVVNKFRIIDSELADMIVSLDDKKINLLPVIINNNSFDDMNQNFMLALRNALGEADINDIVPSTTYKECLDILTTWELDKNSGFDIFEECLSKLNVNLDELKMGLKNYDSKSYSKFAELFKCVSHGYEFNPLISNDISIIFSEVAHQISKYGYTGIFCIFDEFGVFLDNQSADFMSKLNKIQSFAEKANSSTTNCQIHFCCITHKDIMLYQKNTDILDEFIKISGRFKQIRFDRSLDENYQIICSALNKQDSYVGLVDSYIADSKDIIEEMYSSNIFASKEQLDYILSNGYPFNPVALYSLIQISEKIGQNERTLFTFISDNDVYGFRYFISNNDDKTLNVDSIYDYFENIIKNDPEYKTIFINVETAKKRSIKDIEHSIFKAIAIMKIINDDIKLPITVKNISLALSENCKSTQSVVNSLIEKNILKMNINDDTIDYSIISNTAINKQIDELVAAKYREDSLLKVLNSMNDHKYYISNRYNIEEYITRFYTSHYIESSKFKYLNNIKDAFCEQTDGLVLNIINDDKSSKKEISDKIESLNCPNLIVRFSNSSYQKLIIEKIKTVFGSLELLKNPKINPETKSVLEILIDDYSSEINKYMKDYYNSASLLNCQVNAKNINDMIYKTLKLTYPNNVVFNNEMVNKNAPSAVIVKSRNLVIDNIIKSSNTNFGTTSAEATINYCLEDAIKRNPEIIATIKNIITNSNDGNTKLSDIYNVLSMPPYGMRKGIMPLLSAVALSELSVSTGSSNTEVLLFNNSIQIDMNSTNLSKAFDCPDKYSFFYAQVNAEKLNFVKSMLHHFGASELNSFSESAKLLVSKITSNVLNLSPTIIKSSVKDNILGLNANELCFKEIFMKSDINPFEVLFEKLTNLFGCNIKELSTKIYDVFDSYQAKMDNFYEKNVSRLKSIFVSSDSIKSSYDLWKQTYNNYLNDIVFNDENKKIYNAFESSKFNDKNAINLISNAVLNATLEDWNNKKETVFYEKINKFIETIKNYDLTKSVSKKTLSEVDTGYQLSMLGNTLYSNLKDSIDEYGSSLSNEEKAVVLKKILNDILN